MEIRLADLHDLNACLAIDDSFETEYVWQMDEQNRPGQIAVNFRVTRLPRPMRVSDVILADSVIHDFQTGGMLFVADDDGVCGFIDVVAREWEQLMFINNFAVAPAHRRKGVGTRLMRAALDWGRQQKLRVAILDTSTKDYPAICFYQKQGFTFCGFNDHLYPNRDIALYFAINLH
ncbi:MAG: GNAT family N-acetyltransferase [Chloroflexi bacterium]|nr:GNAT family N-acetyltransferase [Chloroflexota bacterium]